MLLMNWALAKSKITVSGVLINKLLQETSMTLQIQKSICVEFKIAKINAYLLFTNSR